MLTHIEERMDDLDLAANRVPVKQMLIFFCREMNQEAVVCLDALDEHVRKFVLPELVDGFVVCGFQGDAMFHAVWYNAVQGPKQPVEETGNP